MKVGLYGIGLDTYWPQFEGLKERLLGYLSIVEGKLVRPGVELVNLGLIDNPEAAFEAGHRFRREDVDIIFLYVSTYALSHTVLPVVQRAKVPVIVLNLSPEDAIDYENFNKMGNSVAMTGEWLSHCSTCPVPEIANVFKRTGIQFHQVTGKLHDDPECWDEIDAWVDAAKVADTLFHNRLGLMGHYYGGMLDIQTDLTLLLAKFGGHIEHIEVDELTAMRREVSAEQVSKKTEEIHELFDIDNECSPDDIALAAQTSVALDTLVQTHKLGSLAYYYMGGYMGGYMGSGIGENEETIASIIIGNSLLTANHVPVAGEYDVKNAQAMKIMDSFGVGGSFTEFYAMDWKEDVVLMGHDGPGHIAIAQGKIKVKPLKVYHGKVGSGLSVEMAVKYGPVTLLSVVEDGNGSFKLLVAEGESVPGPILEIGNTNSRYQFSIGARAFVNGWNSEGPAHHCAVGVGHIANKLEKLGSLLGIDVVQVC